MIPYPTDAPVDAVSSLVAIVKSGSYEANKAEFGLAVWNVQGYIQKMALGSGPIPLGFCPVPETHEEAAALACSCDIADGAMGAIPWMTLLPLVKYGLKILLTIL